MKQNGNRQAPGRVRDAIFQVMSLAPYGLSARQIADRIRSDLGPVPESSIRSYLSLNTPNTFIRESRGVYRLGASHGAELQRPLLKPTKKNPSPLAGPYCFTTTPSIGLPASQGNPYTLSLPTLLSACRNTRRKSRQSSAAAKEGSGEFLRLSMATRGRHSRALRR